MRTAHWFHSLVRILLASVVASGLLSPAAAWANTNTLLSMPPIPGGYLIVDQPMEVDGKEIGRAVAVVKGGAPGQVMIIVETSFDRSTRQARVAATKGYVNGTAVSLKKLGMQLVDSKLPDLEQADFTTPLQVDMTFAKPDGTKLYTRQFIFFSNYGYNVQIVSTDPRDVDTLAKWAQHIKPAE